MLKTLSLAICLVAAGLTLRAENKIPEDRKTGGFFLGCQAYTFKQFSVLEAIEMTAQSGGKVIEFYPNQKLSKDDANLKFDHHSSPEAIRKVKDKLAEQNIKAVNYGVVPVPKDEAKAREIFEFAKTMGLRAITTESVDAIDTIEKLVKEYDIMVGFHDHPRKPNNPDYRMWDPNYILSVVKHRDRRIGSCADTGHWMGSNLKPVDCLRILKGRIISVHLKDENQLGPGCHCMPFGTGAGTIPGILDNLRAQRFTGNISIEYEHNWEHSLPDVAQCVGFVRGYGAAKKW